MTGNFWRPFSGNVFWYFEVVLWNTNPFMVIQPKTGKKFRYFCPSPVFTFYSLVQLLLPTVKLNGVSQPVLIEYKMVHGFNQAVFRT